MTKKKKADQKKHLRRADNRRRLIGACLIAILVMAAVIASWAPSLGHRIMSSPAVPLPSPSNPSKEYIYAGGRLVATEEPGSAAALPPPGNLEADTISGAQIDISWAPSSNAHHYQVERASNLGGTFTILNSNVTGTTFQDTSVANPSAGCNANAPTSTVCAYVYRVRAADAVGNLSTPSNVDLATAITFADDPLPNLAEVRATHILQLREAVNAARAAANLGPAVWFQSDIQQQSTTIMAIDVEELRTALDAARERFGLPTGDYTDSSLHFVLIYKDHIKELRDRVK